MLQKIISKLGLDQVRLTYRSLAKNAIYILGSFFLISIPISLILGLGVARILTGYVHAVRQRNAAQVHCKPNDERADRGVSMVKWDNRSRISFTACRLAAQ